MDICFNNETSFATAGVKHLKFWTLSKGLTSKSAVWGKRQDRNVSCIAFHDGHALTGTSKGSIIQWAAKAGKNNSTDNNTYTIVEDRKLHDGVIDTIRVVKGRVITGGRDGKLQVLDTSQPSKNNRSFNLTEAAASTIEVPFPLNKTGQNKKRGQAKPRAIDLDESGANLVVGTAGSEIYKIEVQSTGGILKSKGPQAVELLVSGHYAPKNKDTNEVWGLCAIPRTDKFVSVSDDGTLRVWSASKRKQIELVDLDLRADGQALPPDSKTNELSWAAQARSVDVSADGGTAAVGFRNGEVRVYRTQDWKMLKALKKPMAADEWIEDLKFSPDLQYLAVSSHDNKVYVFSFPNLDLFCTLKGSSSFITHLDWSEDSRFIRTNDGSYELLFYAVKKGNQAPHAGSALKDTVWHTSTCPISWAT